MSTDDTQATEHRVLLRTATARDALMTTAVLERAGLTSFACPDTECLIDALALGAGAIVLSEETLNATGVAALSQALAGQPPWSDMPVLLLARQGADSRAISLAMEALVNITVIERPVRVASLVTSVRTALRARSRQYELRGMLKGLQENDQRKTEFLATLAHELRNPLAPLSTTLALLTRKTMEPAEASRHYELMSRQVVHLTRLVDDLMEVSRITRGKIEIGLQDVDVESVIRSAIEQSLPLLRQAGHGLNVQLPSRQLTVRGDPMRLTQVFVNLLNNAAKYTAAGGDVSVNARAEGDAVLIEVTDSGIGIESEMLGAVFDMFVQANGSAKLAQGGLGIGLTLVKSLVELHGGQVTAQSGGLEQGTTLSVRLPLAGASGPVAKPAGTARQERAGSLAPTQILLVDDNRDAVDTLSALLGALGASNVVAYDAEEALHASLQHSFDIAILDLGMPGMDGYELARRLRQTPGGERLMLIALTGWGQPADRERARVAGFDHHCLKPIDLDHLLHLIRPADSTLLQRHP